MSWYDIGSYNLFDWFVAGVIIISVVVSTIRGFVREALALTAWGVAAWLAYLYSVEISGYLEPHIHTPSARLALTVIGVFVIVLILSALLRVMILYIIQSIGLSVLDHLLGSVFGFLRGMVISMLLAILLHSLNLDEDDWWKRSVLAPYLDHLIAQVPEHLPATLSKMYHRYFPSIQLNQTQGVSFPAVSA